MHFTHLLMGIVSLLSVTTAIPMSSNKPTPTSSMLKSLISPSSASVSASASPTPSPNPYEAYTCPKGKFKSCCMSVQQTGKDVIKPLGELVPIVGGLELSSAISFQCKRMADKEPPATCNKTGYNPMCCNSNDTGVGFNTCKPFDQVKKAYYAQQMEEKPETQAEMIMDILT
ncbi:uncharacterized protein PGRI_055790 [Penicillium griseofulvum]|uniref:Hydrophobin n=1 Tax=Penicillium patulum TaxID=5078 RepID=A0A135LKV1_PENPA|nr:uncharacterized protein PGRI_055790 [Penicillium griseofulvum]KXG49611.1 hypothetical protein PGRI_055790 [Penicillium griseofulvum]